MGLARERSHMVDSILVPVDGSDPSRAALSFALEEHPDVDITAVHVVDPGDFYGAGSIEGAATYEDVLQSHKHRAEELLEEFRERAAEAGASIETDYLVGDVSSSIVEYVDEHDIDQIVIGSHGRTGASRVLLGSIAETVTRRSKVPVTVVR